MPRGSPSSTSTVTKAIFNASTCRILWPELMDKLPPGALVPDLVEEP
jgi:hypothetical protein